MIDIMYICKYKVIIRFPNENIEENKVLVN